MCGLRRSRSPWSLLRAREGVRLEDGWYQAPVLPGYRAWGERAAPTSVAPPPAHRSCRDARTRGNVHRRQLTHLASEHRIYQFGPGVLYLGILIRRAAP